SGRAVSVQLEAAPQMVTAMASPAGRLEKSSMPIQAVPASVRPTQTPQPSRTKIETTSRVMTRTSFMSLLRGGGGQAAQAARQFVDHGHQEQDGAHRHADLRDPQRRGVVGGGDVVVEVGVVH